MKPADPQTEPQDSEPAPDHASGAKSERSSGAVVALLVAMFVLAPIVYIAAIGPIVWLESRGFTEITENSVIATIYTPVILLAENVEPIDDALTWYVGVWETPQPAPVPVVAPVTPMPMVPLPSGGQSMLPPADATDPSADP